MSDTSDSTIFCAPISLLTTTTECYRCGKTTQVSSLKAAAVMEDGEEVATNARLSDCETLPPSITARLRHLAPNMREAYSRTAGYRYWANHCEHCGALQGDFFLHHEPDGPFFGEIDEGNMRVEVIAEAGRYTFEANVSY